MFLSIESKHPKFYQVFRIFIVFLHRFCMHGTCVVLRKLLDYFRAVFRSVPALTENRADLFPY